MEWTPIGDQKKAITSVVAVRYASLRQEIDKSGKTERERLKMHRKSISAISLFRKNHGGKLWFSKRDGEAMEVSEATMEKIWRENF